MNKAVQIRRVRTGDEQALAYVQTESWKAAFKGIVPADLLSKCTQPERAAAMYKRLLDEQKGNGYILELDGKPHCIAWWDAARDADMAGFAELICIHSLKAGWRIRQSDDAADPCGCKKRGIYQDPALGV